MLIRASQSPSCNSIVSDRANSYELVISAFGQCTSDFSFVQSVMDRSSASGFLNRIHLDDYQWFQLFPGLLNQYPDKAVTAQVAELIASGVVRIYQLPSIKSAAAIPFDDKTAYKFLPAISREYLSNPFKFEKFYSVAKAQAVVNGIKWTTEYLYRALEDVGADAEALKKVQSNGNKNLDFGKQELIKYLVDGKAGVYKVERITASPSKEAKEELVPLRTNDKPPPLAPETPKAESKVVPSPVVNPELEKREKELKQIGVRLRNEGYILESDADVQKAIDSGQVGNPRYLVSIQKSKSSDEPIGYRRQDTGRTTMWTTTYDMLKKGDLSAPLLMSLLGSNYDPATEYTMYIFDQGENFEQDGALTFSPTWENMKKYCPEELHMDDPEDPIHDKELLASVMNPDIQKSYQQTMESFWADTKGTKKSEYNMEHLDEYLSHKGFSEEESDQFKARHLYRTQIGANAYFLGTGATDFTLHEKNRAAISNDGIAIKGEPGKLGVPEMLTIEKNPSSIKQLEKKGLLKAIPLKGLTA